MPRPLAALLLLTATLGSCVTAPRDATRHDVVVYGCTSAGIMAAVQTRRMGCSVVVVGRDRHLGGLSAGGLGWTDSGKKGVIGGLAREFYGRVYEHYADDNAWRWQSRGDYGNSNSSTSMSCPPSCTSALATVETSSTGHMSAASATLIVVAPRRRSTSPSGSAGSIQRKSRGVSSGCSASPSALLWKKSTLALVSSSAASPP
jgi:hypothetical protein